MSQLHFICLDVCLICSHQAVLSLVVDPLFVWSVNVLVLNPFQLLKDNKMSNVIKYAK